MGLLLYIYDPFWQEVGVKSLILRWPLRPVGLLLINQSSVSREVEFKINCHSSSTQAGRRKPAFGQGLQMWPRFQAFVCFHTISVIKLILHMYLLWCVDHWQKCWKHFFLKYALIRSSSWYGLQTRIKKLAENVEFPKIHLALSLQFEFSSTMAFDINMFVFKACFIVVRLPSDK